MTSLTSQATKKFSGFETDIHGLVKDGSKGAVGYYVDCVGN